MPEWCDKDKIGTATNQANFLKKSAKLVENENYQLAFKAATEKLYEAKSGPDIGVREFGARAICNEYNTKFGLSGIIAQQLRPPRIMKAFNKKCMGKSLLKQGHPEKVPPQFTTALATHSTMMQVAATDGKESGRKMIQFIKVMTDGTIWDGTFSAEYAWRKAYRDHPKDFVLAKAKNHKDQQAELLTAQNIND